MTTRTREASALVIVALALGGCYANVEPPEPAYSRMQELCANNGGLHIFGPAVEVKSFLEEGGRGCGPFCKGELRSGYAFIEARADRADLHGYVLQPGLYRFSSKPGGHSSCEAFYQNFKTPPDKRTPAWPCVGAEPIAIATSTHRVGQSFKREQIGTATLVARHDWIEEVSTGRKLAEVYAYSLHWEGIAVLPAKGDRVCPRDNPSLPIRSLLMPAHR